MSRKKDPHNTVERLTKALDILATHKGDVRERLYDAFMEIVPLRPDEFSKRGRVMYEHIHCKLMSYGPVIIAGKVYLSPPQNAVRKMRRATAQQFARMLFDLYWEMSSNRMFR